MFSPIMCFKRKYQYYGLGIRLLYSIPSGYVQDEPSDALFVMSRLVLLHICL